MVRRQEVSKEMVYTTTHVNVVIGANVETGTKTFVHQSTCHPGDVYQNLRTTARFIIDKCTTKTRTVRHLSTRTLVLQKWHWTATIDVER